MAVILYAGDELGPDNIGKYLDATRAAGWTSIIISFIHVTPKGDLTLNGTPIVTGGQLSPKFATWQAALSSLKTGGTISEIYLSIGGDKQQKDFANIETILKENGGWSFDGTNLKKNIEALHAAIPAIDGMDMYVQDTYDTTSFSGFSEMVQKILGVLSFSVSGTADPKDPTYPTFEFWIGALVNLFSANLSVNRFNLQTYVPCATVAAWDAAVKKAFDRHDYTNFFAPGCMARNTTDGGKTWNGMCPSTVELYISEIKKGNIAPVGGGFIFDMDYILQTSTNPAGCDGPATMADYAKAVTNGLTYTNAPAIVQINTIDDLRQWAKQAEGANLSRIPKAARATRSTNYKPCLVGFDMGEFQYDPWFDLWSQGTSAKSKTRTASNVYNFSYWQYVDAIYYFGHNFVTIPPLVWTNCAHKNGVECFGTVNLNIFSSTTVAQFLTLDKTPTTSDGPLYGHEAIELLLAIQKTFGFDGYLFNYEQAPPEDFCTAGMLQMLKILKDKGCKTIWYDSPFSTNGNGYNNRLTKDTYPFFQNPSYFQSNYRWGTAFTDRTDYPKKSYEVLAAMNAGPALEAARMRMFQGLYCATPFSPKERPTPPYEGNFFHSIAYINSQQDPTGYYTGLNLFYPDWIMYDLRKSNTGKNTDELPPRHEFHNNDEAFWNGSKNLMYYPDRQNPDNPINADQCLKYYLSPPRTVITKAPFVCWFNDGEGDFYNIDGTNASAGPWNNLSDQSVLPSYRYEISGNDVNVKTNKTGLVYSPESNLFTGGSSLSFDFETSLYISASLFQCSFALTSTTYFTIIVKESGIASRSLIVSNPPSADFELTTGAPKALKNGWFEYKFAIPSQYVGKDATKISLKVVRSGFGTASFYLGRFAFLDEDIVPPVPQNFVYAPADQLDWSENYRPTSHYRIYGVNAQGSLLIGVAYNSVYRIAYDGKMCPNTFNSNALGFTKYIVQEVNEAGEATPIS